MSLKPGVQNDLKMSLEIHKQNAEFKAVNFGQTIDHNTFEKYRPLGISPDINLSEYRKWKRVQVIL